MVRLSIFCPPWFHSMPKTPNLKRLRQESVLSQQELATKAGVAKRTIINLELARTNAHPATVRKLAHALGVSPKELTGALESNG